MKIFSSVWLHYENCCRKYFHVFSSILKMLFSYKFFTRQFNSRQQTPAIKSHNHQNTTTTPPQQQQKSKSHKNQNHTEREIGGSKIGGLKARSRGGEIEGEIERRGAIGAITTAIDVVRSGACNRRTGAREIERGDAIGAVLRSTRPVRLVRAIVGLELGVCRRSSD